MITNSTHLMITVAFLFTASLDRAQDRRQSDTLSQTSKLTRDINELKRSNSESQRTIASQQKQIDALTQQLSALQSDVNRIGESSQKTDSKVALVSRETQGQIQGINHTITNRTL